jgi:tRNA nucleotidyltransferase (CCA-adding enzyme)
VRVRAVVVRVPRGLASVAARRLAGHRWPAEVLAALERLRADGHQAYLVGGTVRDVLMGRADAGPDRDTAPADNGPAVRGPVDIATDRTPREVMSLFPRVEPIGIEHGTVLVLMDTVALECTTFRREDAYSDARHPDAVSFTLDLREDLARRDFTVNAMAFDPLSGVLVDACGGLEDLERRRLRAVGDPLTRFREDALRPLRAARFVATLGLELDPATRGALGGVADRARLVAMERVREELARLMAAPRPSVGLERLREAGLLELWLPELAGCYGVPQNRWHAHDVYVHALETCDHAPATKARVRWAALLHDIGKPGTRVERRGDGTFYEHERVGAELADRLLERLRFPAAERAAIVHLVREHMFDYRTEWSDAAVRRWVRRVGEDAVADLFDLRIADMLGNGLKTGFPAQLEPLRRRLERVLAEVHALQVCDLAVDGGDVMRVLGIGPGPAVGAALAGLLEEVLEDPSRNTRERLLAWLAERRGGGGA